MKRSPYQGVTNIIRFNPSMFIAAAILIFVGAIACCLTSGVIQIFVVFALAASILSLSFSLIISHWIYDRSDIYTLPSLKNSSHIDQALWLSITAGFDEITPTIKVEFPNISLRILDFYDPSKHTEPSIARARNTYPPHPETETISSNRIPASDQSVDKIIAFFSLHEIRNHRERIMTFKELHRTLSDDGELHLTEHLRDIPNFIAYSLGTLHFFTKNTWLKTFEESNFCIKAELKTTPFITTFILVKK